MAIAAPAATGLGHSNDGLAYDLKTAVDAINTHLGVGILGSVADAAGSGAIPLTHRYVAKTIGSSGVEALTLADGTPGQEIFIACVVVGTGTATITPATASGFSVCTLIAAGDNVALRYVDDTVGWVVLGTAGVLASPLLTA